MLGRIDENIKAIREVVVNMQKFNPTGR